MNAMNARRALAVLGVVLGACTSAAAQGAGGAGGTDTSIARGVLRAEKEAVLSSTVSERITAMPFREGDRFPKGAALVTFDCGRFAADLRAARAGEAAEARNASVQTELLGMGATGKAEADIAGLKQKERAAQAQTIQERMTGCKVIAPFAGRVVETMARAHEAPPANEKLIRIVSDGPLELHMVVPSRWLGWLKVGSSFDFKVDETGDTVKAVVDRISGAVDAVSQTVKIICKVPTVPASVLPGMSGQARLQEAAATAVPAANAKPAIVPTTGSGGTGR
ncbi:efflux RND transporter periplasmic adaptor subunit [Variovorax sp. J22R133]|uniref:efflux RND transporter periplasmic adaptor subunit n=1 Tax=Variovorax brevis TaxID=3053503 RepID=UPI00257673DF|nr:efflux RND transporter periplasmic adaptor subunit [Variovorax sp. J22R133]MDM0114963.1 efflux RND transporter periplasmic adaptor subunit [Variovorax sp. J22R133]